MDINTIFTKTDKAIRAEKSWIGGLSTQFKRVLSQIDGSQSVEDIQRQFENLTHQELLKILHKLEIDGYIHRQPNQKAEPEWLRSLGTYPIGANSMVVEEIESAAMGLDQTPEKPDVEDKASSKDFSVSHRRELGRNVHEEDAEKARLDAKWQEFEHIEHEKAVAAAKESAEEKIRLKAAADLKVKTLAESRQKVEEKRKAQAESAKKVRLEALEQAKRIAEAEAKARQELERIEGEKAEALARAEEVRLKVDAEHKAEAEAAERIRLEAERIAREAAAEQARLEHERKLQEESAAKAQREAEERARLEADRVAREKAEALARAEEEARLNAEAELKAQAAAEEQARLEAERRALAAEQARLEGERMAREVLAAKAQREAEEKARQEAERIALEKAEENARAQAEAAARLTAEREAEAEAMHQAQLAAAQKEQEAAALQARRDAERIAREAEKVQLEAAKKAQLEIEKAVKNEAKRLIRQEKQAKAQLKAEEKARIRQMRGPIMLNKWAAKSIKAMLIVLPVMLILMVGLIHVINLTMLIKPIEKLASEAIGEPVTVQQVHASLFPQTRLTLSDVAIGSHADTRVGSVQMLLDISALFKEVKELKSLELSTFTVSAADLGRHEKWLNTVTKAKRLKIGHIALKQISFKVPGLELEPLNGKITQTPSSELSHVELVNAGGNLTLLLTPQPGSCAVELTASSWKPPLLNQLELDEISAKAVISQHQASFSQIEAKAFGGSIKAQGAVDWTADLSASGNFELEKITLSRLLTAFGSSASVDGSLNANVIFASKVDKPQALVEGAQVNADFEVLNGKINGLSLSHAVMAGPASKPPAEADFTRFDTLSGHLQFKGGQYQYKQLVLKTEQFRARGDLSIEPNQTVSGKVSAELTSKSLRRQSGFAIGGKVAAIKLQ